ncbi:hypothetical protein L6R29_11550 [Myxococcota bacterium]|nr:hypothetical protein [Myxococcota bacterium]
MIMRCANILWLVLFCGMMVQPACTTTQQTKKPTPPEEDLSGLSALEVSKRQCRKGVAKLCQQLGEKYERGLEVTRDLDDALGHYRLACNLKDPLGCYSLGRFLLHNLHHTPLFTVDEIQLAQRFFVQSCEDGFARACIRHARYIEASMFYEGNRQHASAFYRKAAEFAQASCQQRDRHGCYALAWLYEKGIVKKRQERAAMAYYKLSCGMGLTAACYRHGRMILGDWSVVADLDRAFELFRHACQQHDASGCFAQAEIMLRVPELRKKEQHLPLLQYACHHYHGQACAVLARLTTAPRPTPKQKAAQRELWARACRLGSAEGCFTLAQQLDTPIITSSEKEQRHTALLRACSLQHAVACSVLGDLYEQGRGLKQDCVQARRLKKRACRFGLRLACLFTCD